MAKDVRFEFDDACLKSFNILKKALISAPIIQPPDWSLSFEIMCDASDYAVGAVLGQTKDKNIVQLLMLAKLYQDLNLIIQQLKKNSWLLFLLMISLDLI